MSIEVQKRQKKIIAQMPRGANTESERAEYATFLIDSLEQCPIQDRVKKTTIQEISKMDYQKPAPSLYRRLSWKALLALDEKAMRDDPKTKDEEKAREENDVQPAPRYLDCKCNEKKEPKVANPLACFVRALQEQVGPNNATVLFRGDVFTCSFGLRAREPFPWKMVTSLEANLIVRRNALKNVSPIDLIEGAMVSFKEHAKNWGSLELESEPITFWKICLPTGGKIISIPFDIGPSDVIDFSEVYGNVVTTTGVLFGCDTALHSLSAQMARLGMGLNYHRERTVNLYKHAYALTDYWLTNWRAGALPFLHPDIFEGWGQIVTPVELFKLMMLLSGLRGDR